MREQCRQFRFVTPSTTVFHIILETNTCVFSQNRCALRVHQVEHWNLSPRHAGFLPSSPRTFPDSVFSTNRGLHSLQTDQFSCNDPESFPSRFSRLCRVVPAASPESLVAGAVLGMVEFTPELQMHMRAYLWQCSLHRSLCLTAMGGPAQTDEAVRCLTRCVALGEARFLHGLLS